MARTLSFSIERALEGFTSGGYSSGNVSSDNRYLHMQIDTNQDTIELPILALPKLKELYDEHRLPDVLPETLDILLFNNGARVDGKALETNIKNYLYAHFPSDRLVLLPVKDKEETINYYCTQGAVFNEDFSPLMVCSWVIRKSTSAEKEATAKPYMLVKPLIRISPDCVRWQSDPMERFISKKFIQSTFSIRNIDIRYTNFIGHCVTFKPEVVIADFPFTLRKTIVPSISTNNKDLLKIAEEHINDVM